MDVIVNLNRNKVAVIFIYFINFLELIFNLIGLVLFQIDVSEVVEIMHVRASQLIDRRYLLRQWK